MSNRFRHLGFGLLGGVILLLATGCASGATTATSNTTLRTPNLSGPALSSASPVSPTSDSSAVVSSGMVPEMASSQVALSEMASSQVALSEMASSQVASSEMASSQVASSEMASSELSPPATGSVRESRPTETSAGSAGPSATPAATASAATPARVLAAWQQVRLTDTTGSSFTVGELAGKPVFVEFFATWCPTCRAQLGRTNEAAGQLDGQAVFLALSTETDLSSADLAEYKRDNDFSHVRFAVMSPAMLAAIVQAFGNDAANPPSTPHLVVSSAGTIGELRTGSADAASIVGSVNG